MENFGLRSLLAVVVLVVFLNAPHARGLICKHYNTSTWTCEIARQGGSTSRCSSLEVDSTCRSPNTKCLSLANYTAGKMRFQKFCVPASSCSGRGVGFCDVSSNQQALCLKCCGTDRCNGGPPPQLEDTPTLGPFIDTTASPNPSVMATPTGPPYPCFKLKKEKKCQQAWRCIQDRWACTHNDALNNSLTLGASLCLLSGTSSYFKARNFAVNIRACLTTNLSTVIRSHYPEEKPIPSLVCTNPILPESITSFVGSCLFSRSHSACDLSCPDLWTLIRSVFWKTNSQQALPDVLSQAFTQFLQSLPQVCKGKPLLASLKAGTCLPVSFNDILTFRLTNIANTGRVLFSEIVKVSNTINTALSEKLNLTSLGFSSVALPAFRPNDGDNRLNRLATVLYVVTPTSQLITSAGSYPTAPPISADMFDSVTSSLKKAIEMSRELQDVDVFFRGKAAKFRVSSFTKCRDLQCSAKDPNFDTITPAPSIVPSNSAAMATHSFSLFLFLLLAPIVFMWSLA